MEGVRWTVVTGKGCQREHLKFEECLYRIDRGANTTL